MDFNTIYQFRIAIILFLSWLIFIIYILRKLQFFSTNKKILKLYPNLNKNISKPSNGFIFLRIGTYLIIFSFITILLIWNRPSQEQKIIPKKGIDIVFLIDVSLSMNAKDLNPSRLDKVKESILQIVPELAENRLGIIVFAGSPFLYCPLTTDIVSFMDYIKSLDTKIIGDMGSDIHSAMIFTDKYLNSEKVFQNKLFILITDGGDEDNINLPSLNNHYITWGAGTNQGTKLIYEQDKYGRNQYVKKDGNLTLNASDPEIVYTKLNTKTLSEIKNSSLGYTTITNNISKQLKLVIADFKKNDYLDSLSIQKIGYNKNILLSLFFLLIIDFSIIEFFAYWRKK